MPDTPPGRTRAEDTEAGHWESITRDDYFEAIDAAGGLETLGIYSSLTRVDDRYFWTARHIRGAEVPLVASELDGCDDSAPAEWATCPGTHTFWRFVPAPGEGTS